jgi:predicted lipoprotein with Yx(FWY)xxD motif
MRRNKHRALITGSLAVPIIALAATACGNGASRGGKVPRPPKTSPGVYATVGVGRTSLGPILVDSRGRTVYLFKKDAGPTSICTGACAAVWPPVLATNPTAGAGADVSLLGSTRRTDGATQVTYNGHPLYLFVGDQKAGDTNGQAVNAFGAAWFVLSPTGSQISSVVNRPANASSGGSYWRPYNPPITRPLPSTKGNDDVANSTGRRPPGSR